MKKHYEMRFGGTGGQGMMLMGDVTAEAAGIKEGKEILLTKSYGPESRGGACRSEIIIDDDKIAYPVVSSPDMVVVMSQKACDSYTGDMPDDGILLTDSDLVRTIPQIKSRTFSIPLTRIAKEVTGKEITANVVALGAVAALSEELDAGSVKEVVIERFPEKFRKSNMAAFEAGEKAASECLKQN